MLKNFLICQLSISLTYLTSCYLNLFKFVIETAASNYCKFRNKCNFCRMNNNARLIIAISRKMCIKISMYVSDIRIEALIIAILTQSHY